jgi:AmmeMemoRadiSam system protein A
MVDSDALSVEDRAWLLARAREVIAEELGVRPVASPPPPSSVAKLRGAFVSLYRGDELRGCVGTIASDRPLDEVVAEMAVAAGFRDPRFSPLVQDELAELELEISVLGPLIDAHPEEVVPGVHGVAIAAQGRRAVYLPKVASEAGWDREQLLGETCLKAGLEVDAWRDPATRVSIFTAVVFGDSRERD